eukprot:261756-Rhodomonas_salina.6
MPTSGQLAVRVARGADVVVCVSRAEQRLRWILGSERPQLGSTSQQPRLCIGRSADWDACESQRCAACILFCDDSASLGRVSGRGDDEAVAEPEGRDLQHGRREGGRGGESGQEQGAGGGRGTGGRGHEVPHDCRDVLFTHMLREGAVMCMLGASSCSVGPRQCSEVGCPATALPPLTQCVPGISFLRGDRV